MTLERKENVLYGNHWLKKLVTLVKLTCFAHLLSTQHTKCFCE